MNWNWSHIRDEEFKKHIGFNNPNKIMKKYFAKKFKFDPLHQIEKEFYQNSNRRIRIHHICNPSTSNGNWPYRYWRRFAEFEAVA